MNQDSPQDGASLGALTVQVNSGRKYGDRSFSGFPSESSVVLLDGIYAHNKLLFDGSRVLEKDIVFKNDLVRSISSFFVRFWKQTRDGHAATAFLCGIPLGWFPLQHT